MSNDQTMQLEPGDQVIQSMIDLIPDYSTGARVHELIVNRQMGALPGEHKPPYSKPQSFRGSFYDYRPDLPLTQYVELDTGLNSLWWENFSVALLCQAIQYLNSSVGKHMGEAKISNAVEQAREMIHQHLYSLYARVLREFALFEKLLLSLKAQGLEAEGKAMFRKGMLRNAALWTLWYAEGWWKNRDWDLFNNYAKYIALGADAAEVDVMIEDMRYEGLPIPDAVDKGNWRHYTHYLDGQPAFDHNSIDDTVRGPVLATYTYMGPGGYHTPPQEMKMKNYYSGAFIDKGQPGARFRK